MTFKEKLVKLRKLKGITQDEFASAVGVSRQAVYKWESGQSYPEVAKLIEIKALFNISIDDLLDDAYEVVLPEKQKRRTTKKAAVEQKEIVKEPAEEKNKEETTEAENNVLVTAPVIAEEKPALEEVKAEPKEVEKRGFFSRLFGR